MRCCRHPSCVTRPSAEKPPGGAAWRSCWRCGSALPGRRAAVLHVRACVPLAEAGRCEEAPWSGGHRPQNRPGGGGDPVGQPRHRLDGAGGGCWERVGSAGRSTSAACSAWWTGSTRAAAASAAPSRLPAAPRGCWRPATARGGLPRWAAVSCCGSTHLGGDQVGDAGRASGRRLRARFTPAPTEASR